MRPHAPKGAIQPFNVSIVIFTVGWRGRILHCRHNSVGRKVKERPWCHKMRAKMENENAKTMQKQNEESKAQNPMWKPPFFSTTGDQMFKQMRVKSMPD
jgi:hypothetical protein